mmetsp:Transcript_8829/g.33328  ORF Transcript_8829/g.33328 Transcript_8829/m.33328 type:complete len:222 (+) Transcript_8829:1587-2252(+)
MGPLMLRGILRHKNASTTTTFISTQPTISCTQRASCFRWYPKASSDKPSIFATSFADRCGDPLPCFAQPWTSCPRPELMGVGMSSSAPSRATARFKKSTSVSVLPASRSCSMELFAVASNLDASTRRMRKVGQASSTEYSPTGTLMLAGSVPPARNTCRASCTAKIHSARKSSSRRVSRTGSPLSALMLLNKLVQVLANCTASIRSGKCSTTRTPPSLRAA